MLSVITRMKKMTEEVEERRWQEEVANEESLKSATVLSHYLLTLLKMTNGSTTSAQR